MQVGDIVTRHECVSHEPMTGIVTYVHPENRYYTVRFDFKHGRSYTESYIIIDPERYPTGEYHHGQHYWPKMERDWMEVEKPSRLRRRH